MVINRHPIYMACRYSLAVDVASWSTQIWLDDVSCNGYESRLALCSHRGYGINNCDHSEDVALECGDSAYTTGRPWYPHECEYKHYLANNALKALCQHNIVDRKLLKIASCTSKQKPSKSNVPFAVSTLCKPSSSLTSPSF